jgi:predicted transcriptional regulator
MGKRGKLEIIRDILQKVYENKNSIKSTPLLRKSGLSSGRFKEYCAELLERGLIRETTIKGVKLISLTDNGFKYLNRYKAIVNFIEEFDL